MFPTIGKSSIIIPTDWSGDGHHLKDFVKKFSLPTLAKIKRGEYSCVGSGKKLHDVIYIHSTYASQSVIAESHFSGKNTTFFAIPVSYGGWFDVLSEDKKYVKPVTSVLQFLNCPSKLFLVRENTKLVSNLSSYSSRKSKELEAGEILKLNEKQENSLKIKKIFSFQDANNKTVFLDLAQKFSLSPISKDDDVCGVHSIKDLLEHFSFPITVQLAHGEFFSSTKFHPIFKLIGFSNVQYAIMIPLKATAQVLSIPSSEMLILTPSRDHEVVNSDEFKEISKFAHSIENQQQKTISQVTISNLQNINKNRKPGNSEESSKNIDHSAFEEIDAIYKFIREGGELSDFSTKDQFDDSTQVSAPTRPIDASEREIWEEPIYADISKLKTQKLTKKKNRSRDSELANIGSEQKGIEKPQKMNSSYKKNLQKYKNKLNSTLQRNSIETKHENVMQTDAGHHNAQDFQEIHKTYSPFKTHDTRITKPDVELKSVFRKIDTSLYNQSISGPKQTETKRENKTKLPQMESQYRFKNQNTLEHKDVQKFKATSNRGEEIDATTISKAMVDEKEQTGWKVSILKNDEDEDTKKTCVKINYQPPVESTEAFQPDDTKTENSGIGKIEHSDDRYTITFKQMPQDTTERESNLNSKMNNYRNYDNYSVDGFIEPANLHENTSVLNITSPSSSTYDAQTLDSPVNSPNSAISESTFFVQNTTTSSESLTTFSENVSTIRIGSCGSHNKNNNSNERRVIKNDDSQSVKIICNSSSNFGGTLSSKTILGTGTLKDYKMDPDNDQFKLFLKDESNHSCDNTNYPGITTIKIDKSGSSSQLTERNNISDKQVVNRSPFGNTQIFIRQAFPSKGNFSASSKLYVNKS